MLVQLCQDKTLLYDWVWPSYVRIDYASINAFCRLPSQRDGQVKEREHHGALVIREQVSDDGGGDGWVAGLSDANQSPGEHKQPVVLQRDIEHWMLKCSHAGP